MAPDERYSIESRVARLEQKVSDLGEDVRALAPLAITVVTIENSVKQILDVLGDQKDAAKERRAQRRALWALTVAIICALIGAAAVLLSSGVHG